MRGVHRSRNNSRAALPSKAHHSVGGDAWQLYPRSSLQDLRAAELVRESPFLAVSFPSGIAHLTQSVTSVGSLLNSTGEDVLYLLVPQVASPAVKADCDQEKDTASHTFSSLSLLLSVHHEDRQNWERSHDALGLGMDLFWITFCVPGRHEHFSVSSPPSPINSKRR